MGILKHAIIILLTWTTVYTFGAFILWDLNPGNWSLEARLLMTFVSVGMSAAIAAILFDYDSMRSTTK